MMNVLTRWDPLQEMLDLRSITLPSSINAAAIEARYDNGVLKLRLLKAEEARSKHIQIQNDGGTSKTVKTQTKGTSS